MTSFLHMSTSTWSINTITPSPCLQHDQSWLTWSHIQSSLSFILLVSHHYSMHLLTFSALFILTSTFIHFDLQLQPSSRFDLRSSSRLCHTRMVCWLGVSRFRKMRKRLGACGFTPNRAWHHESGVPFHRVWCGGQTLFAAGLPFSLSCEPSLHVGAEDRRSL